MQDCKSGDGYAPRSIEGVKQTGTPSPPSWAHLLHRKEDPPKHTESDTLQVSISHSNLNHLPICPERFPCNICF